MTPGRFFALLFVIGVASLLVFNPASGNPAGQTPDLNSLSDGDFKSLTIQLERTACYGTCPAYAITIHGDGKVEYVGKKHVKVTDPREKQIDAATVKALVAKLSEAKFASIPDQYSGQTCTCRKCTDFPSATIDVHTPSGSHRVEHYHGCACAPKALFDLENGIDKAAGSQEWTGDTSKAGPFGTTCFGS